MSQHLNLLEWAKCNHSQLHPAVEIYDDELTGLSFHATHDIDEGTNLVECAYETTLSYLNAIEASSVFSRHDTDSFPLAFLSTLSRNDPNVIGHFFLIQQYLLGEKSFWWNYVKLLPQPNEPDRLSIPILWPASDQRFLDGTNAEPAIRKRSQIWEAEWSEGVALLRDQLKGWEDYSYALYQWAAAIFGSRSFRPSLTLSPDIVRQMAALQGGLIENHVAKDSFPILLPVLDIGNHNGYNEVEWSRTTTSFRLLNRMNISKGSQIYNFYGNKSNSELLVAYGFLLPQISNDKVNLKVSPLPEVQQLRRSQISYNPPINCQPEDEFMFNVGINPSQSIFWLSYFSDGLFETIVCMAANARERQWMLKNLNYCPEKDTDVFQGYLARSAHQALVVLKAKLELELNRLQSSRAAIALTRNQHLALEYRRRQEEVLETTLPIISRQLDSTRLVSIDVAFAWLDLKYPTLSTTIQALIAEDQDESLPLNWEILAEDWDRAYLIVWTYILLSLEKSDPPTFQASHSALSKWLSDMQNVVRATDDDFFVEESERETVDLVVNFVAKQFEQSDSDKYRMRNLASFIVKEEAVMGARHCGNASDGKRLVQDAFCINME